MGNPTEASKRLFGLGLVIKKIRRRTGIKVFEVTATIAEDDRMWEVLRSDRTCCRTR
jgi:predicted transcriptional regulator with HTH domain